jgi:penicillin amidase
MAADMASPTLSQQQNAPVRRRRRLILRIAVLLIIVVALTVGITGWWIYSVTEAALPQLDGGISIAGFSAPVKVIRDTHGVPHISAANLNDLLFAQGYVTAQDRLWQMDMARRVAAGELSEILSPTLFGENVLRLDERQRIFGLRVVAEQAASRLTGDKKAAFEAFARGVNAYIDSHADSLPPEFHLLHYRPKPWTPTDSFLIGAQMVEELQYYQVPHMWDREWVTAHVGPQVASELYVNTSWRDHPPTATAPDFNENPPPAAPETPEELGPPRHRALLTPTLPQWLQNELDGRADQMLPGSNNWVVSGAHTATGKPLLSNDMHLAHQVPGIWYESQLSAPGIDVTGVTFPGIPFIIVGHNQRIAWGSTNVGPTTATLYIESFNANGEYQTPSGWQKPEHRREVIRVRGGEDVVLDVVTTRHGPIVSSLFPGEKREVALKWTAFDPGILDNPFLDIDRAQNWDQFKQAIASFGVPSQNFVYADVDGNIGYIATGKVPIRKEGSCVPVSGADDVHEWGGYIPFEQMPQVFNPPSGIIATANGRITPDGYPYMLSCEWGSSERQQRIYHLLSEDKKFTSADMLGMEMDIYASYDQFLAQRMVYAIDHSAKATARAKHAADLLRGWDGQMRADAAQPRIVVDADHELRRLMLEPRLGGSPKPRDQWTGWRMYQWANSNAWMEATLLQQSKDFLPPGFTSYNDLLAAAVDRAVSAPGVPSKLSSWKWGDETALHLKHPIFGMIPVFQRWAGPGYAPQSGSATTIRAVGDGFGPSERYTADLSNLDATTFNITTGESGNIFSPYFMDHWPAWYHGTTFVLPFSEQAVGKAAAHTLILSNR